LTKQMQLDHRVSSRDRTSSSRSWLSSTVSPSTSCSSTRRLASRATTWSARGPTSPCPSLPRACWHGRSSRRPWRPVQLTDLRDRNETYHRPSPVTP